jgi:hypothetical protein
VKQHRKGTYSSCKKLSCPSSGAMNPLRDEFDSFLQDAKFKSRSSTENPFVKDFDLGLVYFLPKTQNFSRFLVTSNL